MDDSLHQLGVLCDSNFSIDNEKKWIIDSGCSHHATGNDSLLSSVRQHDGERVIVTADNSVHPVIKEGNLKVKAEEGNIFLNFFFTYLA